MDRRVVAGLALVGVALLVGAAAAGAFEPLYTTEGYQPSPTPAPTATDGGETDGATAVETTATGASDGCTGHATPTPSPAAGATETYSGHEYEHVTVAVVDAETNGTCGVVKAAVAETFQEKYTGLSKTESLPEDRGMLFVYDEPDDHTYVMREMDFGLDIIYVDEDGTITEIHHAPEPPEDEDGEDHRYPGYGQYVLEVNYEWTVRHDVSEGDRIVVGDYNGSDG